MQLPKESKGGVTDIARKTIRFMSKRNIPLLPKYYRIWFEYFRGNMAELKEVIDKLLAEDASLNQELHERLYSKFLKRDLLMEDEKKIEAEMKAVEKANTASRKILQPVVKKLGSLSKTNYEYGSRLESFASKISESPDTVDIGDIVKTLVNETSKISSENSRISAELAKSSRKLETLRKNLDSARLEARIDDLTQLQNRRAFNERLAEELNKVKTNGNSCVAIIDIDRFKRINDNYGHIVGDKALCAIAKQINDSLSPEDLVYRYGGEEFTVIMTDTPLNQGLKRLDEIRRAIAEHEFVVRDNVEIITISIGIVTIDPEGTTESCMQMADEAMYLAKKTGRNSVKSENDLKERNAKGA